MINFQVVKSLEEIPKLSTEQPTFSDIETHGLYINTRLVQVYQPTTIDMVYILDTDIIPLEDIKEFLKPLWTIWQGCSYDFGTLNMTTARFDDTLYLAKIAYPQWQEFSLDNIVAKLGHNSLYEGLDKKKLQKAGFIPGAYLSQAQLRYSATDVVALSLIWQNTQFQKCRESMAYKVDILSIKYAIEYQQNGLISDQAAVMEEIDNTEADFENNSKILNGINCNSYIQVRKALNSEESSKEFLIKVIGENQGTSKARLAKAIYDQRRVIKRRTMLHSYNFPKVYTRFNVAGAATGRFTSTGGDLERGINAQQIPRPIQYIFNTNTADSVVVHADYSTAELRAGCSIMRDENMYKELMAGMDLHKAAANLATGVSISEVTKADRQKGKAVSFGFIFGMSAPSFVEYAYVNYGVIFTQAEAKVIKEKYNSKYKNIALYHKARWNDYKDTPVITPLGHRNKARLGTDAINHATQGCIAETMKLAIHYLCSEFPEALKYIFNIVHDAAYLRVPKGQEEMWAERLVTAMKKGWTEMCKCDMLYYKDIPMPVEVEWHCPETDKHIVKEY